MDGWRYLSDLDKCTCCGLWIVHWHRRWDNLHNPSGSSIGGASDGVAQHLPSQEPYPVTQLFSRGKSHGDFPTFPLKLTMFPPHWWRWDCWKQFQRWGGSASGWLPRWLFLAVHPCSPLKPVGWRPIIEGFWKVGDPIPLAKPWLLGGAQYSCEGANGKISSYSENGWKWSWMFQPWPSEPGDWPAIKAMQSSLVQNFNSENFIPSLSLNLSDIFPLEQWVCLEIDAQNPVMNHHVRLL